MSYSPCVRVLFFGDCLAGRRLELLKEAASANGMTVEGVASSVDDLSALDRYTVDAVILYPWTYSTLIPLWAPLAMFDESVRSERVAAIRNFLTSTIRAVLARLNGELLIVQGLSGPMFSPQGRLDFRQSYGYKQVFYELNAHICSLIRDFRNALFVDEEGLFSSIGKQRVLNYASSNYGEFLGGTYNQERRQCELSGSTLRVSAKEYANLLLLWSGQGRIKAIAVDLDNTLWPGEISEGTVPINVSEIAMSNYGGLHEALLILKQRGILLATCSRNSSLQVLASWERLVDIGRSQGFQHLLSPADFVLHQINWNPKRQNMSTIARTLGCAPEALAFIDDSPTERFSMREAFPEMWIMDSLSKETRYQLLTDPRFETLSRSSESSSRTETTKAQLRREEEQRASRDEDEFLKTLSIRLTIAQVKSTKNLDRIIELIQRTHQFNTAPGRYDSLSISDLVSREDVEIYTLCVLDRFTNYGLVGACIICDAVVELIVLSCRVIGLRVDTPFLSSVLRCGRWASAARRGRVFESDRNEPCKPVFTRAGFAAQNDGWFVFRPGVEITGYDMETYAVTISEEDVV